MKRVCCIVAAGPSEPYVVKDSYIIAADAGITKLDSLGIAPDIIIGDFDSLDSVPQGDNVIVFPVKKDDTDTLLALKEGMKAGYDTFYISGGVGGQLDHTVANLQSLAYARENGVCAYLIGNGQCAVIINSGLPLTLKAKSDGRCSVFAFGGDASGVYIEGLSYEGTDITLKSTFPLGVSNSFNGGEAKISCEDGCLLVIFDGTPEDVK